MGKIADDTHAVGLDDVLAERFGMERRQLTMPIDGLGAGFGIVRRRFDGTLTVGGCEFRVFRHDVCSAGFSVHEAFREAWTRHRDRQAA